VEYYSTNKHEVKKETISRSLSTGWTNVKNILKKKQEIQPETLELVQTQHSTLTQNFFETATFSLG
jgi:hypothetical protein